MPRLRQIRIVAALQKLRHLNHIAPILAARIEREHKHIAMFRNFLQKLQIHRRHRRNAEHEKPLGQMRLVQRRQQLFPQRHTVRRGLVAIVQIAPKLRLPNLVLAQPQKFAFLPGINPLRPVHQILVENIRQLPRQLIIRRLAAAQIALQDRADVFKFRGRLKTLAAEQIQKPPAHYLRRKRTERRNIGNQFLHQLPRQTRRQAELQIRRHPQFARQIHAQITPHPLTLHHNLFRRQSRLKRPDPLDSGKQGG